MVSSKKLAQAAVALSSIGFLSEAFCPTSNMVRQQSCLFGFSTEGAEEILWRHVKKPLLRLGAKGASVSHGNSLKQLLEDHTAVKVKVNTKPYDGKNLSSGKV